MAQQEENAANPVEGQHVPPPNHVGISKRITDHLANQRTFLAWIRTGIATVTFGFVVARFGLLLRDLGIKNGLTENLPIRYSTFIGVSLTILGVMIMIVALFEFLHIRRSIDSERFHPPVAFSIILTILTALVGITLAIYLYITA